MSGAPGGPAFDKKDDWAGWKEASEELSTLWNADRQTYTAQEQRASTNPVVQAIVRQCPEMLLPLTEKPQPKSQESKTESKCDFRTLNGKDVLFDADWSLNARELA